MSTHEELIRDLGKLERASRAPYPWQSSTLKGYRKLAETLKSSLSQPVQRLLAVECVYRYAPWWDRFRSEDSHVNRILKLATDWLLSPPSLSQLMVPEYLDDAQVTWYLSRVSNGPINYIPLAANVVLRAPAEAIYRLALGAGDLTNDHWKWCHYMWECAAYPREWNDDWNSSIVVTLARGIFDERAFDRMPILADALQDADCANENLLKRLRNPKSLFTRADVALWRPMGFPEVSTEGTIR